jgi:superfamily II DNA or RNA helicase/HKD family nuclease
MKLVPGLYEQIVTPELEAMLERSGGVARLDPLHEDAAADLLSRHVYEAVRRSLSEVRGEDRLQAQIAAVNRVLAHLASTTDTVSASDAVTAQVLLSWLDKAQVGLGTAEIARPGVPLRHSELIVNGPRDLRVGLEIQKELPSADRVDLLMSFVKWNGFVELRGELARVGGRLRVLTTTYLGATDVEALEGLRELGAQIRVSYDERRTRLHAKAWLFHRESGFSTAVVGSSNLSHSALRDGCEWNVRLSQRDNPALIAKFRTTFDQYWDDPSFEPYDRDRFLASVGRRRDAARDALAHVVELRALPHQATVLESLRAERERGHCRNLVVAATGTGKTVVAALDYARLPNRPRLLFVAHQDRILDQSLATFRVALRDGNFGEKLTGREKPIVGQHVFASIQSLHQRRLRALAPNAYEVVVVDEFHHAAADTYDALLQHLRPTILVGLTATPERADGRSILHWFDGRVAAETRLWDALDQDLLSPFQYFVVHDGTDLSQVDFRAGRYDVEALEHLYTADDYRARQVLRQLAEKVRSPRAMRALGFCVSNKHAHFMAAFFARHGLPSAVVDKDTSPVDREARVSALEQGQICCIFTVNVFNEGVDIPLVDTVLFLRPTESATIFLQQLGRGLRTHDEKACLTVLDFVGNAHEAFRFDLRFKALLGGVTRNEVRDAVESGFPRLPSGCAIHLEERAQRVILDNLKRALSGWRRLADDLEAGMTFGDFLRRTSLAPEDVYRQHHNFSELLQLRGLGPSVLPGPLARTLPRLLHVDDEDRLGAFRRWLAAEHPPLADEHDPQQRMLFALLGDDRPLAELGALLAEVWSDRALRTELSQLFAVLDDRRRRMTLPLAGLPLRIHARYTRAEVSAALGLVTEKGKLLATQSGVFESAKNHCDLLFVTLDKDEKSFTPTTLYDDYPITPTLFHWQSQSRTRESSPTGMRYQNPPVGWRLLLFVRRAKKDERGVTQPFLFLGPVEYVSHHGERPMSITWRLAHPMPGEWFQQVKIAAG